MQLVDTHCHIHEAVRSTTPVFDKWHAKGDINIEQILADAKDAGVMQLMCVGTTLEDSKLAIEFVSKQSNMTASIGIHPHEAKEHQQKTVQDAFAALAASPDVKAVGECGLDYFYSHSSKEDQVATLKFQFELAQAHDLPMIFHVREAFDDFWPIFEQYHAVQPIRGVLHSFTDSQANMEKAVQMGLYIGINGIATFTKDPLQLQMYQSVPLMNLLLETDAPFLTPAPYRGMMCEPKHVRITAEFIANLRGITLEELAAQSTANAQQLFGI